MVLPLSSISTRACQAITQVLTGTQIKIQRILIGRLVAFLPSFWV